MASFDFVTVILIDFSVLLFQKEFDRSKSMYCSFISFDHKFEKHKMLEEFVETLLKHFYYTIEFNTKYLLCTIDKHSFESRKQNILSDYTPMYGLKMQLLRSTKSCTVS